MSALLTNTDQYSISLGSVAPHRVVIKNLSCKLYVVVLPEDDKGMVVIQPVLLYGKYFAKTGHPRPENASEVFTVVAHVNQNLSNKSNYDTQE